MAKGEERAAGIRPPRKRKAARASIPATDSGPDGQLHTQQLDVDSVTADRPPLDDAPHEADDAEVQDGQLSLEEQGTQAADIANGTGPRTAAKPVKSKKKARPAKDAGSHGVRAGMPPQDVGSAPKDRTAQEAAYRRQCRLARLKGLLPPPLPSEAALVDAGALAAHRYASRLAVLSHVSKGLAVSTFCYCILVGSQYQLVLCIVSCPTRCSMLIALTYAIHEKPLQHEPRGLA